LIFAWLYCDIKNKKLTDVTSDWQSPEDIKCDTTLFELIEESCINRYKDSTEIGK